jgi:hypothetical protein
MRHQQPDTTHQQTRTLNPVALHNLPNPWPALCQADVPDLAACRGARHKPLLVLLLLLLALAGGSGPCRRRCLEAA